MRVLNKVSSICGCRSESVQRVLGAELRVLTLSPPPASREPEQVLVSQGESVGCEMRSGVCCTSVRELVDTQHETENAGRRRHARIVVCIRAPGAE